MINSDICAEVEEIVKCHYIMAENHFKKLLVPLPTIKYNLHGTCAGTANSDSYPGPTIQLNPHFFETNKEDMMKVTVPHEVAHLIADKVYGSKKRHHGPEWKSVMCLFGLKPERCHNYSTSQIAKRKTRKFTYYCRCYSGIIAGLNVHRKIQAQLGYSCRKCKKKLRDCPWEEK